MYVYTYIDIYIFTYTNQIVHDVYCFNFPFGVDIKHGKLKPM